MKKDQRVVTVSGDHFHYPGVPTDVVFGDGVLSRIGEYVRGLGGSRVLLVSDSGVANAGLVDTASSALRSNGCEVVPFLEVPQDSSSSVVEAGVELLKKERCDIVVGLGGGSPMDAAKAVAVGATNSGPIVQYAGLGKVKIDPLPVIAVPTTAGTGSEVSFWAIMTDVSTREKIAIGGPRVFPSVAVCDPELTLGLPAFLTATTGMDALTHAIESASNLSYQPISEILSLRATSYIFHSLERAVKAGSDIEARRSVMLGSTLAGMGMNPTRLGLVHALAMPLGSWDLQIPHGAGIAVLLPHAMAFNSEANPGAYQGVAEAIGVSTVGRSSEEVAADAVSKVRALTEAIGIPSSLATYGLTQDRIAPVCSAAMKSGNIPVNPRTVTQEQLELICHHALRGTS